MKKFIFLGIVALVGSISACKRDALNATFVGPPSEVLFTSTAIGLNTTTVDFALGQTLFYKGKLNQPTYWSIKIKGLTSGGVKEFSGFGDSLDSLLTAWDGSSDSLYFFRAGETCSFALNISGRKDPIVGSIVLVNAKVQPTNLVSLINNFQDGSVPAIYEGDPQIDGTKYSMSFNGFPYISDSIKTIDGNFAAVFGGDLTTVPGKYFLGGTYMNASATNLKGFNKDSVYLNVFAKSAPSPYANRITIQVSENDGDVWAYDSAPISTEWQLVSIVYANLTKGFGSTGNGVREPDKLSQANLNFVTVNPGGKAKCYVDYYCVTYGSKFKP